MTFVFVAPGHGAALEEFAGAVLLLLGEGGR